MNEVNFEVKMQAVQKSEFYLRHWLQNLYNIMILVRWNPENKDYPLFLYFIQKSIGITVYSTMTVPCGVPVIYMELLWRC